MQSISAATYSSGISVLRFHKPMIANNYNCNSNNASNRGILHWTPPSSGKDSDKYEYKNNFNAFHEDTSQSSSDCCTLDTSTSSSRSDSMEVDNSLHFHPHLDFQNSNAHECNYNCNYNRNQKRKRRKHNFHVRFTPGTASEPTKKRILKKRKHTSSSSCDPSRWYTKQELKEIQKSCIFAVKTQDFMASMWPQTSSNSTQDPFLDRFSLHNRKRRKLVRWKMNETTKVVKEFETVTGQKVPPELLSELLRLHSKPMEMDAVEWALNMKKAAAASDASPMKLLKRQQLLARDHAFSTNMLSVLSNGVQQLRQQPVPSQQSRASLLRELQLRGL